MEIKTARGLTILADDEDADLLASYSWVAVRQASGRYYAHARMPGAGRGAGRVIMHRLIMQPPVGKVIHHINNNGLDNRRSNLMITSNRANIRFHYEERPTGVHFHGGRWRAQTRDKTGKRVSLGMYATQAEAYSAVRAYRDSDPSWPRL